MKNLTYKCIICFLKNQEFNQMRQFAADHLSWHFIVCETLFENQCSTVLYSGKKLYKIT